MQDSSIQLNYDENLRVEYFPKWSEKRVSWIKLNHTDVIFDKYGYPMEAFPVEIYGYWSFIGMSSTLPKYYYPDEK